MQPTHATEAGAVEAAKTLLEFGANKNLRHLGGFTPRNVAIENITRSLPNCCAERVGIARM